MMITQALSPRPCDRQFSFCHSHVHPWRPARCYLKKTPEIHFLALSEPPHFITPIFLPAHNPFQTFVTTTVTLLLQICYKSNLNSDPILPKYYKCYDSKKGKKIKP